MVPNLFIVTLSLCPFVSFPRIILPLKVFFVKTSISLQSTFDFIFFLHTQVNGLRVSLPHFPSPLISLSVAGQYVILTTPFGLEVQWDGNHYAKISVPRYWNSENRLIELYVSFWPDMNIRQETLRPTIIFEGCRSWVNPVKGKWKASLGK